MNSKSILTFIGFCLFFSTCKISDKNKVYDEEIDIQNIEIQSFINFVSLQEYENADTTIPVSDMFGVPSEDCYYRFFTPNENYTVTLIFNKKEGINFRGSFSKKIKHTDEERFFPMDTLINRSYRDVYYIYNGKKEKMKLEYSDYKKDIVINNIRYSRLRGVANLDRKEEVEFSICFLYR